MMKADFDVLLIALLEYGRDVKIYSKFSAARSPSGNAHKPKSVASSFTDVCGPVFEGEARDRLRDIMASNGLCPWATQGTLLVSRKLDGDDGKHEADIFCYIGDSSTAPLEPEADVGLRVVEPWTGLMPLPPVSPLELPAGSRFSPDSKAAGPLKYFVAEASCTKRYDERLGKLRQLEGLLDHMVRRWQDRTAIDVSDITAIIGVGGLVFSAGNERRKAVLDASCAMVARNAGPFVKRLVQAGRFFVLVLDKSQSPLTFVTRETEKMRIQLETIPEEVAQHLIARGLRF